MALLLQLSFVLYGEKATTLIRQVKQDTWDLHVYLSIQVAVD